MNLNLIHSYNQQANRNNSRLTNNNNNNNLNESRLSKNDSRILNSYIEMEADHYVKEAQQKIEDENEFGNLHLEHYNFAVNQKFDFKTKRITYKKLVYVFTEALSDLGLQKLWSA